MQYAFKPYRCMIDVFVLMEHQLRFSIYATMLSFSWYQSLFSYYNGGFYGKIFLKLCF